MDLEFCVMQYGRPGLHRGPWSEKECLAWIAEAEEDGVVPGTFYLATRLVSPWKKGYSNGPKLDDCIYCRLNMAHGSQDGRKRYE